MEAPQRVAAFFVSIKPLGAVRKSILLDDSVLRMAVLSLQISPPGTWKEFGKDSMKNEVSHEEFTLSVINENWFYRERGFS